MAIAKDGLVVSVKPRWPGKLARFSKGRVFFSCELEQAMEYAFFDVQGEFVDWRKESSPVLLRVHADALEDAIFDGRYPEKCDFYVERSVPSHVIDVWVPEKRAWRSIKDAAKLFRGAEIALPGPALFDAFMRDYFETEWPSEEEIG